MKKIKLNHADEYECKQDWPEDCFVQGGGDGIVVSKADFDKAFSRLDMVRGVLRLIAKKSAIYHTAFFEAFPESPDTFIRGEGKTVEEAEENAWKQYTKITQCPGHEFEARGYKNGCGFCKRCDLFMANVIDLT